MLTYGRYDLFGSICAICCVVSVLAISTEFPTAVPASPSEERLEDEYLLHYKDTDYRVQREWSTMRELWFGENFEDMKKFCVEVHQNSGKGQLNLTALLVQLNINVLRFRGKNNREFARIDVLRYSENETKIVSEEVLVAESDPLFLTNGLRPDCVYYLEPTDPTNMEFFLEAHVCKKTTPAASNTTAVVGPTETSPTTISTIVNNTTLKSASKGRKVSKFSVTLNVSNTSESSAALKLPKTSKPSATSKLPKASKSSTASKLLKTSEPSATSKLPEASKSSAASKLPKSSKSSKTSKSSKPKSSTTASL